MVVIKNKKVNHDYKIEKTLEAGIALKGSEIKSIRNKNISLAEAFIKITPKNEVFIYNMYIKKYEFAHSAENFDDRRMRKLLLHKREISRLQSQVAEQGYTIVPIKMYFKHNKIKIEIGLAKGKKNYDKRHDLKDKTIKREIEKRVKNQY